MGLQAMCFWVMMTYNVMMYEIVYKKIRVDFRSGYAVIK